MITVVLIGALGVALALACAGGVAAWRARASADDRVAEAVASLAAGMHDTMRDLAGALGARTPPAAALIATFRSWPRRSSWTR